MRTTRRSIEKTPKKKKAVKVKEPNAKPVSLGERPDVLSERTRDGVDEFGTDLAQAFVEEATGGDDAAMEHHEEQSEEELGGPFVMSSGSIEFASGTDESNPIDAEREAFPTTSRTVKPRQS